MGVRAAPRGPSAAAAAGRSSRSRSQFPSTTTAHLTTLYSGLPVEEHGLYEWRVYEPRAGDVIRPLLFAPARDGDPPLRIDPRELLPVAERLRARPATVLQPEAIADTPYGSAALAGARVRAVRDDRGGRRAAGRRARADATSTGTGSTPSATGTARRAPSSTPSRCARSTRSRARRHAAAGHRRPRPDRRRRHRRARRRCGRRCSTTCALRPAGSARDLFLHVDEPETVVARAWRALGDRARVCLAARAVPARRPAPAGAPRRRLRAPRARAGWSACARSRAPSAASRATTAASHPRRSRPGSA